MKVLAEREDAMRDFADLAEEYEANGHEQLRRVAARAWHELATKEEAAEAPDYLRLTGEE